MEHFGSLLCTGSSCACQVGRSTAWGISPGWTPGHALPLDWRQNSALGWLWDVSAISTLLGVVGFWLFHHLIQSSVQFKHWSLSWKEHPPLMYPGSSARGKWTCREFSFTLHTRTLPCPGTFLRLPLPLEQPGAHHSPSCSCCSKGTRAQCHLLPMPTFSLRRTPSNLFSMNFSRQHLQCSSCPFPRPFWLKPQSSRGDAQDRDL